jgi:hypothetical protein
MPPELPLDERMGVDFLCENNGQRPYMDPSSPNAAPRPTITTNGVGQYAIFDSAGRALLTIV